jgi:hypothetical protein
MTARKSKASSNVLVVIVCAFKDLKKRVSLETTATAARTITTKALSSM